MSGMSIFKRSFKSALIAALILTLTVSLTSYITSADDDGSYYGAEVTDIYQIDEENGSDLDKPAAAMELMEDYTYTYDSAFEARINDFPESYKDALRRIHTMYPNFTFVADKLDMTLEEAVNAQIENGYKTYRSNFTEDYDTIYKFMDPLTYLYPAEDSRYDVYSEAFSYNVHRNADFFVFAEHEYTKEQYGDALQYLVDGCDFLENEDMNSIIRASAMYKMNPYVMASTVILEKGWSAIANGNKDVTGRTINKGTVTNATVYSQAGGGSVLGTLKNTDVYIVVGGEAKTSDGKSWYEIVYDSDGNLFDSGVHGVPGFVEQSLVKDAKYFNTYYNLFSINQTDNNPVVGGIAYAMSHGWTSLASSFEGGANFCKTFYYDNNQNTYYYVHYNVKNPVTNWWHEYSTGVSAGLKCARILRYAYDYDHSQHLTLHIPVYKAYTVKLVNSVWTCVDTTGKPVPNYNGLAENENGIWYIKNGKVDFSIDGVANIGDTWYYFNGGRFRNDYTGLAPNKNGWWRIVDGIVDFGCTRVVGSEYGWWYCIGGRVAFEYTGIAPNENGWWRIVNGQVDFDCNSIEMNEYGWFYLRNGQVDFSYTGLAPNAYGWWMLINGKVDFDYNGLVPNENGWWLVQGGRVNFDYTGIAPNEYGWWRIENGKVNFDFTGIAENENGTWYLEGGCVQFGYTGTYDGYNIVNGKVQ